MDSFSHMEISPARNVNRKRSRDDDDESSRSPRSLRPAKRPALGMDFPLIVTSEMQTPALPLGTEEFKPNPNINTWRLHEDWVNKTSSLRLDSPIPAHTPDENDIGNLRFPMGTLSTLNVHLQPTYLPTPKHSPLVTPVEGKVNLLIQGEPHLHGSRGHTPPRSAFNATVLEDEVMQSPEARPGSPQKRRIYMGYRDDCESCRLRVPGHFNHYI